jgi:hypothetical protein
MTNLSKVHLIFKTHLDVGFTDYSRNVVRGYFEHFIPKALATAKTLRDEGRAERFVWTTGVWLIYEYLESANPAQRSALEAAILAGDITWHGLPFTTHTELMDASLFQTGLGLSQQLDRRFGKKTIAAKMTDVPGHTRAMVPLLAAAGIKFLHIGVNPAASSPDVPPVFVWCDEPSGTDIMVMYHKGSYGDLMQVPGMTEAIAFAHTGDNLGPQAAPDVIENYQALQAKLPQAAITASTLDNFAEKLLEMKATLPVVTAEIGDTWIHGVGTDPAKVSQYRELLRLRHEWANNPKTDAGDPLIYAFERKLLMIPEHTWGMDIKTHLIDWTNYSRKQFEAVRGQPNFKKVEASWQEQRDYVRQAVDALPAPSLKKEAEDRLAQLKPVRPRKAGFKPLDLAAPVATAHYEIGFDAKYGTINHLREKSTKRLWAAPGNDLARFVYEIFSKEDYDDFYDRYIINKTPEIAAWAVPDNTKPGMDGAVPMHQTWCATLLGAYRRETANDDTFLLEMTVPDVCYTDYGAPRQLYLEVTLPREKPSIELRFQWFDKPANRLPEALWLSFAPRITAARGWTLDKMGRPISPLDVVRNGNRHLHAVSGVTYQDPRGALHIESLDAPLVAPGESSLVNFNNKQPALKKGMHFNLFNNVWGTNFPMWYEDDALFRFSLDLPQASFSARGK